MCRSRKYPYLPHGRSLEIPRGGGGGGLKKSNFLKQSMKQNWKGGGGGGVKQKTFRGGRMDIC